MRHLLSIEDLDREGIERILARAASFAEVSGRELEPEFLGAGNPAGEIDRQFVDSAKLRELTGWKPAVGLRDGLIRTLDWYRDHPEVRP